MAASAAAKRLTEAHRLAQARLGAKAVHDLLSVFPLLDVTAIDATTTRWLRVAIPLVQARRRSSATLAASYINAFRAVEAGDLPLLGSMLADTVTLEQLVTSLTVTGPVALKRSIGSEVPIEQALRSASVTSSRAGMRHALNGGRETSIRMIDSDRIALGWARATSGAPCAFCAMLASRGPVYKTALTAGGDGHRYHDACHCTVEPVYHPDAEWPPGARRYQALWNEAKTMAGDTTTNFRHLVEAA